MNSLGAGYTEQNHYFCMDQQNPILFLANWAIAIRTGFLFKLLVTLVKTVERIAAGRANKLHVLLYPGLVERHCERIDAFSAESPVFRHEIDIPMAVRARSMSMISTM